MNKRGLGRFAFPGLLLFAAGFLWLDPSAGRSLHEAFSPAVRFLSLHDAPAERIPDLLRHPVIHSANQQQEEPWELGDFFWLRELTPHEVMLGLEPRMSNSFEPGWVAVSRVGNRHMRHRALIDWIGLRKYEPMGKHQGRRLWTREKPGRTRVTLALASGMLVAVMHPDADAIREVLDRLDGRRPRIPDAEAQRLREQASPDRAFWRGDRLLPFPMDLAVEAPAGEPLQVQVTGPLPWNRNDALHETAARFGGPHAVAMFRLGPWPTRQLLTDSQLLLMGQPYQSMVAVFGFPTLVLLQQIPEGADARDFARRVLEAVSRESGLSWDLTPMENGWQLLPGETWLRPFLRGGHTPGARWEGDLLVVSSSLRVAEQLLQRFPRPEARFELRDVAWQSHDTHLWLDGGRLATELTFVSRLLAQIQGTEAGEDRSWREGLAALSGLSLRGTLAGDTLQVQVRSSTVR